MIRRHVICDEALDSFGASSKMNNEWSFLQHLHEGAGQLTVGSRRTLQRSATAPRSTSQALFRRSTALSRRRRRFQQPKAKPGVP
jgi:hypothetical protein